MLGPTQHSLVAQIYLALVLKSRELFWALVGARAADLRLLVSELNETRAAKLIAEHLRDS